MMPKNMLSTPGDMVAGFDFPDRVALTRLEPHHHEYDDASLAKPSSVGPGPDAEMRSLTARNEDCTVAIHVCHC